MTYIGDQEHPVMAIYSRLCRRDIARGIQRSPFTKTMNTTFALDQFECIREMAERDGLSASSIVRKLIDEALTARRAKHVEKPSRYARHLEDDADPWPEFTSRREHGRRSPAEGSGDKRVNPSLHLPRHVADVSPDIAPRRDGKRSPAEASSAARTAGTARRRDVL